MVEHSENAEDNKVTEEITDIKAPGKKVPKGKRLTPQKTFKRIMETQVLQVALGILILGIILAMVFSYMWHDYYSNPEPGNEVNGFMRYGDELTLLLIYILAAVAFWVALSIAYRPRFTKGDDDDDDDGQQEALDLPFPEEGIEGILGKIFAIAVPFLAILGVLMLLSIIFGIQVSGEDFNPVDNHSKQFVTSLLQFFIIPCIPLTAVFLFMSNPRGLKRLDIHSTMLLMVISCFFLSFLFGFMNAWEINSLWKAVSEGDVFDLEENEFILNYAIPFAKIFEIIVFAFAALIISNLKFAKSKGFGFDITPGMVIVITALFLLLIHAIISLTIFNSDYNYDGDSLKYFILQLFIGLAGRLIAIGGLIVLMIEYSLARNISGSEILLPPEELFGELKEKNPVLSNLFP